MSFFYNLGGLSVHHRPLTSQIRATLDTFLVPKDKPNVDYEVALVLISSGKKGNPIGSKTEYRVIVRVGGKSAIPPHLDYVLVINGWNMQIERRSKM